MARAAGSGWPTLCYMYGTCVTHVGPRYTWLFSVPDQNAKDNAFHLPNNRCITKRPLYVAWCSWFPCSAYNRRPLWFADAVIVGVAVAVAICVRGLYALVVFWLRSVSDLASANNSPPPPEPLLIINTVLAAQTNKPQNTLQPSTLN